MENNEVKNEVKIETTADEIKAEEEKFIQQEFEAFLKEKNVSPEHVEFLKQKFEEFLEILMKDSLIKELKISKEEVVKIVKDLISRYFLKKE